MEEKEPEGCRVFCRCDGEGEGKSTSGEWMAQKRESVWYKA